MSMENSIGILYDRIRWEEKEIARRLEVRGTKAQFIDAKQQIFSLDKLSPLFPPVVIERCVSFYRGMSIASLMEERGVISINSAKVLEQCGNKLTTSLMLSKARVPTPKTIVAFSPESAMNAVETIGYPCVVKPIVGSWGRQVIRMRDRETAESVFELREQMNDPMQSIFYVQEMIERPPRDIRCITVGGELVASVYRYAAPNSWKTNVALGGYTENCPPNFKLEEIVLKASKIMGGGILGVDVMENCNTGELVVHEVNGTVEFKGAQGATVQNIADKIAEYAISISTEMARNDNYEKLKAKV